MQYHLSVIIPFLNEAKNLENLVDALNNYFAQKEAWQVEVIFVDDGSNDDSLEILKKLNHAYYHPKIIKLSKNFGSHAALRAGISVAQGEFISFLYVDLQDPPKLLDQMYPLAQAGNEIVWAVRSQIQGNFFERIFSRVYAFLMQKFANPAFPTKGFDIVLFGQKVKQALNQNVEANSSIFLQILAMGFRQTTIEYHKQARQIGKSKWTLSKKIKLFIDSFIAFSFAPIRLVSLVGLLLFVFGGFYALYIILRKLIYNDLEQGWATLIAVLMIGFGVTNISLGIIAEYLWRTLDTTRKRPVFMIDEIIELQKNDKKT